MARRYDNWLAPCILTLSLGLVLPAPAQMTAGGSGGLAEVQKRVDGQQTESAQVSVSEHSEKLQVGSDPALAVFQTLLVNRPDLYAKIMRERASRDDTTSSAIARRIGSEVLGAAYASNPRLKTTDLQRLYDKLAGSEKPLTILKNDREFVLVQTSGALELFADDTQYLVQKSSVSNRPANYQVISDEGYGGELQSGSMRRKVLLTGDVLVERTTISNTGSLEKTFTVVDSFQSDFKDMFEVRGWKRSKRGRMLPSVVSYVKGVQKLTLNYKGLDGKAISTTVLASRPKDTKLHLSHSGAEFEVKLSPGASASYDLTIVPSPSPVKLAAYSAAKQQADAAYASWRKDAATIETDSADWNRMLERGWKDLYMLKQRTAGGEAIAAGTPWFAAPFGRDQLITSMQTLQFKPDIARKVLKLLAQYQGTKVDASTAEKPGKIMHELRIGEMARNKEIPFTPYYGTVDATPLWVMLLGQYYQASGDAALVRELYPNLTAALKFLQSETAATGYLRYGGVGKEALSNQGWKDSGDSVMYANGTLAKAPIALSEVQGYLYQAWIQGAKLAQLMGDGPYSTQLSKQALALKEKFNKDFWMEDKNFVALALDGEGKQVDVVSSNPGHLLSTGLLRQPKLVAERLVAPDMNCGFGIKTLSANEKKHFENSYHNGSVWPHDVSLIVAGLHHYAPEQAALVAEGLLDAARYQSDFRLPELFGGWPRSAQRVPVPYPVACEPQAWAAGTPFLLLSSCASITLDAEHNAAHIIHPQLPRSISRLTLKNLPAGKDAKLSVEFLSTRDGVETRILDNPGKIKVSVIP